MIVVVGLSHKTASIAVRERAAVAEDRVARLLASVIERPAVSEALIVSTCNRVELVVASPRGTPTRQAADAALAALCDGSPGLARHFYVHEGHAAMRHLFRVAASLDSMVVGEPQILGQVKAAFDAARAAHTVGPVLNGAIPRAIRTAKRVRTETAVGQGQVSVPSIAVDLARQIFGDDLRGRVATLVGSGEMAENVAKLLAQAGARLCIVGRNEERSKAIAASVGGAARGLSELPTSLVESDVVVTSTSAPGHVVTREAVEAARRARRGRSLFLVDLAVPRDVDPRLDGVDGVFLYNVDDLSRVVAETAAVREREAARAEEIVLQELAGWDRWTESREVAPAIVALRERFKGHLGAEVERTLKGRLRHLGAEDRDALERMAEAIVNKLLHEPSVRLRQLGADADHAIALLEDLFALDVGGGGGGDEDAEATSSDDADDGAPATSPDGEVEGRELGGGTR